MSPQKQLRTFISYSRANKQFAIKLATELKAAGFLIWLDQFDIPTGKRWDDEIEKALRECEIFMIVMTPASIASENAKDEIGYAIDHGKRIMPVLLEECEIPLRLRRLQYVDFSRFNFDEGISRAKELLSRLINEETIPAHGRANARKDPNSTSSPRSKERATYPTKTDPLRTRDFSGEEAVDSARKTSFAKSSTRIIGIVIALMLVFLVFNFLPKILSSAASDSSSLTQESKPSDTPVPADTSMDPSGAGIPISDTKPTDTAVPFATSMTPNIPNTQPSEAKASETPGQTVTVAISDTPTTDPRFYTEQFDFLNTDDLDKDWRTKAFEINTVNEYRVNMNNGKVSVVLLRKKDAKPRIYLFRNVYTYDKVILEMKFINVGYNSDGVSLICEYKDEDEKRGWYEFRISNYESYGIYAYHNDGRFQGTLVENQIPNERRYYKVENVLTATCNGDKLSLNINGTNMVPVEAKYGYTEGQVGIGISVLGFGHNAEVEIESVKISPP